MPNWDRYCIICGQDGSYLDFDPPYGGPATQRCPRSPDEGCGSTVAWLEEDDDRSRAGGTKQCRVSRKRNSGTSLSMSGHPSQVSSRSSLGAG